MVTTQYIKCLRIAELALKEFRDNPKLDNLLVSLKANEALNKIFDIKVSSKKSVEVEDD